MRKVTKAIIPVAGLGTRFLPAAKAQPKEMLPLVDKPIIQYIVEGVVDAGITEIIFVTSNGKRALEDHFDRNFELEYRLEQKGKKEELKEISKIGKLANFAFVRQHKPLGDGHAILSALPFIDNDEAVLITFGDDLTIGKPGLAEQLIDIYKKTGESVIGVLDIPKEDTKRYGIIGGDKIKNGLWRANFWIEKPEPKKAPSTLAWNGSAVLTYDVLKRLTIVKPSADGEIRLANCFDEHFKSGGTVLAKVIKNPRFDCGNKLDYVKAQVYFALKRPELKKDFTKYLRTILNKY